MSRCGSDACISKCTTRFAMVPPLAIPTHVTPVPPRPPDIRPCCIQLLGHGKCSDGLGVPGMRIAFTGQDTRLGTLRETDTIVRLATRRPTAAGLPRHARTNGPVHSPSPPH